MEAFWRLLGLVLGGLGGILGLSWEVMGGLGGIFEVSWEVLGGLGGILGGSWGVLEASWKDFGSILEASWGLLEAFGVILGGFLVRLGCLGRVLEVLEERKADNSRYSKNIEKPQVFPCFFTVLEGLRAPKIAKN